MTLQGMPAQINLAVRDESLPEVLAMLSQDHGLQYSFAEAYPIKCELSIEASFEQLEMALKALLSQCNLEYERLEDVYIIKPKTATAEKNWHFEGQLVDAQSGEPLPSVFIVHPDGKTMSDDLGFFSIKASQLQARLNFSHLTYRHKDTLLNQGLTHKVSLQPKNLELAEVVISEKERGLNAAQQSFALVQAWEEGHPERGFYRNFEEFIGNAPSQPWRIYPYQSRTHELKPKYGAYNIAFQISRDSARAMMPIYGFCDGKNIYFNPGTPKFSSWSSFVKVQFVGPYAYYNITETYADTDGMPAAGRLIYMLIDLRNGKRFELTEMHLKRLLKQKPELAAEFDKKLFKHHLIDDYLFKLYDMSLENN